MSKINAIRLVNVNYNHNSIHISDETLHFSGRSTLISLQNGGGKSVLVQLLTAPFVQKRYRNLNERSFASYFTTSKPSFIMVEWVLEDDAGYCLTGMMVRKSQNMDNDEELELINFISEYTEPCEQDINHLPVVESDKKELRIKSFNACHKMFDEFKKERINRFFCYDMNNSAQSRQYFAKLAEYGIDYREWQNIIKKINEEESGLSKLFAECKDEKGLVEKWFLNAVENKLNKDNNRMQEFRNILGKYITTYNENSNKIQQQEKLIAFQQEATPILTFGKEYEASSATVAVKLNKIYECLAELNRFAAKNETEIAVCNAELDALGKQLVHLLHEEFSRNFYYAEDKKEALIVLKEDNEQQSSQLEEQSQLWERRRHILDCADLQERLNEDGLELQRVAQRVAVSRKKNKDLEPEREYIGYLLKEYIGQELQKTRERFQQEESDKKACLDLQKQAKQELLELISKNSEKLNLELVKQHPFLPYALIMTGKEIEDLQRAEKNIYTSLPVPIILRESLTQATQTKVDNGVLKSADVNFFMLFNDNLLNEEKLQRLLAELKAKLQKIEQELQQRKAEYDLYSAKYSELQDQSLSKESYERLKDELLSLQEAIAMLQKREEQCQAEKADNLLTQENISQDLAKIGQMIEKLKLHQEALQQLTAKYQQYLLDNSQLYECSNTLSKAENAKKSLDDKLEKLQNKLEWQIKSLADLSGNMKDLNDEMAQYAGYKQVPKPKNFADEIAQNVNKLKAHLKSIQEKLSGELRALEDNRANLVKKVQKVEQKLRDRANRFGLESKDWVNERYSEAKMQELDAKQKQLTQDKKKLGDARIDIEKRLTQVQGEQDNILRQMEEKCHAVEPLPKDEVVEKNFAEEKNMLQYKRSLKEKLQKSLGEQEQNIRENVVGLAEYSEGATNVEWCESYKLEDFSQEELSSYTLSLRKEYKTAQVQEDEAKRKLEQALIRLRNVEAFQEDSYKKCIDMLQELTSDAQIFVKQLNTVLESYVRISEKLQVDIAIVKQEKEQIITQLEDYLKDVHKQLGYIDRNSSIQIRGHYVKMLKLQLPDWEESANIYHRSITDLVDTIAEKGLAKLSKGEPLTELLGKLLTTKELFDAVVGINNVHVQMFKVEAQREIQISWREVARNSGGEGFLSAFVILSSLLYYMRRDDADVYADRNEGKVLMMDNPFAQTNAAHLLTPLMEMAAKNNTQLISFTGLGGESIYNCYDNIYVLNLISSKLSNISYLKSKHIAGNDGEFVSLARVEVADEGQMDSLF